MTEGKEHHHRKPAFITPSSPPYPPYAYMDPIPMIYDDPNSSTGPTATYAYIYPVSPPFSVQYYNDTNTRYPSYPGSPILHPAPSSPPFSPTYNNPYLLSQPPFPLPIPSPLLTATHMELKKRQLEQEYLHLSQYHPQNIYVRGLSVTETDESFYELCSVYGPIQSSKAILDQKTGECKGYGFAMFEDQNDCQLAINGLNAAGYQASLAKVGQESFSSRLRSLQDETSTNIYISNLPIHMDEEGLERLFKPYQTISNRILRDPQSGLSRGVGFARLADRASASAIIEKFNGYSMTGSSASLQVRFADSPAQKRLKNQTSRKLKPTTRELFPCGFPANRMPVTPETMLGIAPIKSER
ncbi:hypothetical protein BDB01DRAFT_727084 [Pilobolus umbonatus]|nr:hypothetical protein BDB01DRAFT_727084 [Pilobolus umbonatus]